MSQLRMYEFVASDIPTPPSNSVTLFIDSDTGFPAFKDDTGAVFVLTGPALTALAALTPAADKVAYFTGPSTASLTDFTTYARTLVACVNAAAARSALGLAIGTDVQAYDAELAAIAGLVSAANKIILFTGSGTATLLDFSTDGTFAANSDTKIPSEKAIKTYIASVITGGASDVMIFKGVIDCSANPNYPAADAGNLYKVSVAGKIGGASGPNVEVGDTLYCITDSTASGTQAGVGANWVIVQENLDGAVIGPSSVTDARIALFDGTTGKLIKQASVGISGLQTQDAKLDAIVALTWAADKKIKLTGTNTLQTLDAIEPLIIPLGDETTAITTGAAKVTFRVPYACKIVSGFLPRANLNTASGSGNPAFDINKNGVSIFSTTLTIDSTEKTSTTAATPAVLASNPTTFADDDEVTIDIDTAGSGAKGAKITLYLIPT